MTRTFAVDGDGMTVALSLSLSFTPRPAPSITITWRRSSSSREVLCCQSSFVPNWLIEKRRFFLCAAPFDLFCFPLPPPATSNHKTSTV